MNESETSVRAGHELIEAYLDDLARALSEAEPAEREEVLRTIREHIDQALAQKPHPIRRSDVSEIVAALGPAEDVAAELPRAAPVAETSAPRPTWPNWVSIAVLVCDALALASMLFMPFLSPFLALLAVVIGIWGACVHRRRHRLRYVIGAVLGGLMIVLSSIAVLGLISVSHDGSVEHQSPAHRVSTPPQSIISR